MAQLLRSPTLRWANQLLHLFAAGVAVGVPFFLAVIGIPRLEAEGAGDAVPAVVDRFYSIFLKGSEIRIRCGGGGAGDCWSSRREGLLSRRLGLARPRRLAR